MKSTTNNILWVCSLLVVLISIITRESDFLVGYLVLSIIREFVKEDE